MTIKNGLVFPHTLLKCSYHRPVCFTTEQSAVKGGSPVTRDTISRHSISLFSNGERLISLALLPRLKIFFPCLDVVMWHHE